MGFLPGDVRTAIETDLAMAYGLFERVRTYIPTKTVCTQPGCGVDAQGEPLDVSCTVCTLGYVIAWTIQELDARIADVALVTQLFVSITPGVKVGDKMLTVSEADSAVLLAVRDDDEAYIEADSDYWRPMSVQLSQVGRHPEYIAHLVRHTPEATR